MAAVAAVAGLLASGATASAAAPMVVHYTMEGSAGGQSLPFALPLGLDSVTAPATVRPGAEFSVVIDSAPSTVPANIGGATVQEVSEYVLRIPVPSNTTYVSTALTGGSGPGPAPVVELVNGVIQVSTAGPVGGGQAFELPTLTITLIAGASGTAETKLGGTSISDPGISFKAKVSVEGATFDATAAGFPDPSPVLASTVIG
ncbi:cyclase [Amycolatopsis sp. GA6-003]|uniref:cyclase n=1 Tax=Amycolatopsis sp. GA6-003 TaxID=2652444 RepID=UPI0039170499